MFDNICKFLAENFPEDLATWLLGSSIPLTELSPTELSLEHYLNREQKTGNRE